MVHANNDNDKWFTKMVYVNNDNDKWFKWNALLKAIFVRHFHCIFVLYGRMRSCGYYVLNNTRITNVKCILS